MDIEISTCDPACGFTTCIHPVERHGRKAEWILWVAKDGSAQLYTKRSPTGAVLGKPQVLPKSALSVHRCEVFITPTGGVDVYGAITGKHISKGSLRCGLPARLLVQPGEICEEGKSIWICDGHDEYTK